MELGEMIDTRAKAQANPVKSGDQYIGHLSVPAGMLHEWRDLFLGCGKPAWWNLINQQMLNQGLGEVKPFNLPAADHVGGKPLA